MYLFIYMYYICVAYFYDKVILKNQKIKLIKNDRKERKYVYMYIFIIYMYIYYITYYIYYYMNIKMNLMETYYAYVYKI